MFHNMLLKSQPGNPMVKIVNFKAHVEKPNPIEKDKKDKTRIDNRVNVNLYIYVYVFPKEREGE